MVTCTYCYAIATTRDHVPPRTLFAPPRPSTLITVPSCATCNNGAKLDDQYFVDMVLCYHRVSGLPQAAKQVAKMIERTTAPTARGYLNRLYNNFRAVAERTPAGLHLGSAPAMAIDKTRMERVLSRVVSGLFAHSLGRKLDPAAELSVSSDPFDVDANRTEVEQILAGPNLKIVQDGVFWFTYNCAVDNPNISAWLLVFFDEYASLAFVREP